MGYTFVFSKTAKRDVEGLGEQVRKRLKRKFEFFAVCEDISVHAKKLANARAGQFRLRIGDYRIVFDLKGSTCVVLRVQHRKDIYRNL